MAAQLCYQQATARLQQGCQLLECLGRRGEMVQDHVHHDAVDLQRCFVQRVGQDQADVVQSLAFTHLTGQLQHHRAVVQRRDLLKAAGQVGQKAAIAGADFQGRGRRAETQLVEQG